MKEQERLKRRIERLKQKQIREAEEKRRREEEEPIDLKPKEKKQKHAESSDYAGTPTKAASAPPEVDQPQDTDMTTQMPGHESKTEEVGEEPRQSKHVEPEDSETARQKLNLGKAVSKMQIKAQKKAENNGEQIQRHVDAASSGYAGKAGN